MTARTAKPRPAARKLSGRGVSAAPIIGAEDRLHGWAGEGDLPRLPVKLGPRFSTNGSVAPPRSCVCTLSISGALALRATPTGLAHAWRRGPDGRSPANEDTKVVHAILAWVGSSPPGEEGGAR